MSPAVNIRRQYAAEAALVGGRHWRGSLKEYAYWLFAHAHVLASRADGRAEVKLAAVALLKELRRVSLGRAAVRAVDDDMTSREPGWRDVRDDAPGGA